MILPVRATRLALVLLAALALASTGCSRKRVTTTSTVRSTPKYAPPTSTATPSLDDDDSYARDENDDTPSGDPKRTEKEIKGNAYHMSYEEGTSQYSARYKDASALLDKQDIKGARKAYLELAVLEPASPHPYVGLGTCALGEHDYEGAKVAYRKALEKDPNTSLAHLGLGSAAYSQRRYTEAARGYEEALRVNEKLPDAHWGAAIAYDGAGDMPRMRSHAQRFVALAPDSQLVPRAREMITRAGGNTADTRGGARKGTDTAWQKAD